MTPRIPSLLVAVLAAAAPAADPAWPQFRGLGGSGVAADSSKPPVEIGPDKNVAWKIPVPPGMSSPVVAGDLLFLTGFENGKLLTLAYSRADGREVWRAEAPAARIEAYHRTEASPAASSCATDGKRVVSYFGSAGLFCYDTGGKEVWRFDLPTAETNNDFGSGVSPILSDGKVFLVRDLKADSRLIAVDLATGSLAWEKKRAGFSTGWGSPVVWDTGAGKELVVPGALRLVAYDPATGDEKWAVAGLAAVNCTVPVVADDGNLIYAAWSPGGPDYKMPTFDGLLKQMDKNGDGALQKDEVVGSPFENFFDNNDPNKDGKITREEWDAAMKPLTLGKNTAVAVRPGGKGDVTTTNVVWKATKGLPYVPSPLVYRGQMYTVNMRGMVSAYDVKTGKDVFLEENVGLTGIYSSPVAANGYVYLFGLDGSLVVLKAGDTAEVAAKAKFGERVSATPAVVGDAMYVRTAKFLYAFGK